MNFKNMMLFILLSSFLSACGFQAKAKNLFRSEAQISKSKSVYKPQMHFKSHAKIQKKHKRKSARFKKNKSRKKFVAYSKRGR